MQNETYHGDCDRLRSFSSTLFFVSYCFILYHPLGITADNHMRSPGDLCHTAKSIQDVTSKCGAVDKKCYLVSLKIGSAAGGEALLAAEALQLAPHAQRIALNADLLAPGAHDLHVGRIFI